VKVIVDTSVWSHALRRRAVLSGIRSSKDFERLRDHLQAFDDEPLVSEDYERAAEWFNACRAKGVQGSNTDFLICAAAQRRGLAILTTDRDFEQFAKVIPLALHEPRAPSR
jgi:predicted nucleic acid-binding protein